MSQKTVKNERNIDVAIGDEIAQSKMIVEIKDENETELGNPTCILTIHDQETTLSFNNLLRLKLAITEALGEYVGH